MRRALIGAVVGLSLVAGACGSDDDTLSESEIKDVFIEQGVSEELAECYASEIGEISVDDQDELFDRGFEAGQACADIAIESGDVPDVSIPDISIPDISIPDISIDIGE